ncbi:MAG: hypothetical protein JWQ72_3008 [Polaromonas sp.]|nr:hypothetical protein [Polaromonas sp.]
MYKKILLALALVSAAAAWAQGSADPNGPHGGGGGGVAAPSPGGFGVPVPEASFKAQCMAQLAGLASQKLQAQLVKDRAVTSQVLASAKIGDNALGASCSNACDQYAKVSHMISWAHVSPGFLSEPEHTQQFVYGKLPQPPLPGKADLDNCLPQAVTLNWCPTSGSGVGAGPSRQENPMDKIKVCITVPDAFQHMNFSASEVARNCARPAIVDAANRIKAERQCVNDAVQAEAKAAAEANKAAAVYNGPPISSQPVAGGMVGTRKKP